MTLKNKKFLSIITIAVLFIFVSQVVFSVNIDGDANTVNATYFYQNGSEVWDISDVANVTNGDNSHLVLADDIYDWVFSNPFNWITNTVSDLTNYYLKTETYNKSEVYNKSEIDTQGEMETIWGVTLSTDAERTTGLAGQDECSEITGCVENAYNTEANLTNLLDDNYRANSWDNFTGIPKATPSNGDTTHLSTADQIYDWVTGLGYITDGNTNWDNSYGFITNTVNDLTNYYTKTVIDSLGNWSADKSSYWNTSTDLDTVISDDEITESKIDFNTVCGAGNHLYINGNNLACEADDDTTYTAGGGLTLTGNQFNHTDTSSQTSSDNSGRTYIQDIILDTYGHVTGITTATETVTNTDTQDLSYNATTDVISLTDGGSIDISEVNTNANTICSGTTTYLDGEGNCDDISSVYEVKLNNEAGLYAVLSDVSLFLEDLIDDTTPQLGGNLDANGHDIEIDTSNKVCLDGATCSHYLYYNGTHTIIH